MTSIVAFLNKQPLKSSVLIQSIYQLNIFFNL
ncbi:hypothetical protein J608_6288, partial [Acinetobacter baumannii 1288284]